MTALTFVALAALVAALAWPMRALMLIACVGLGIFTVLFMTTYFLVGLVHMICIFVSGFAAGIIAECRRRWRRA